MSNNIILQKLFNSVKTIYITGYSMVVA